MLPETSYFKIVATKLIPGTIRIGMCPMSPHSASIEIVDENVLRLEFLKSSRMMFGSDLNRFERS